MAGSQFIIDGPVYFYVGLGASAAYLFLGWTDTGVEFSFNPYNEDIPVDYAGAVPGDVSQLGTDATISGTFTRHDPIVSLKVASMLGNSNSGTVTPGTYFNNQMGSLWQLEGAGYPIVCQFPYKAKNEFNAEVPGYYFPLAAINNSHTFKSSIRYKNPQFSFRAIPQFGTFNGSTFSVAPPYNASILYTNVLPSLPPPT